MPCSSLPLWAEARTPLGGGRKHSSAAPPPRPAPSPWRQSPLQWLRSAAALLLLALLPSTAGFLLEIYRSGGAIPARYDTSAGASVGGDISGGGSGGKAYSPEVIELLSPIDRDLAPWEDDGIQLKAVRHRKPSPEAQHSRARCRHMQMFRGSLMLTGGYQ